MLVTVCCVMPRFMRPPFAALGCKCHSGTANGFTLTEMQLQPDFEAFQFHSALGKVRSTKK